MQQWEYLFVQDFVLTRGGEYLYAIFSNGQEVLSLKAQDAYQVISNVADTRSGNTYPKTLQNYFMQIGDQGWELSTIDGSMYIFKRPKQ